MKKLTFFTGILIAIFLIHFTSAGQDWALKQLEDSPRHHEWVKINYEGRTVHAFLVYPEVDTKAKAVIVIHENRGLNDWARSLADQVAAEGFIAIAPDLLSGSAPGGGKTSDFENPDQAREAIYNLSPDQVTADLNAIHDYIKKLPASTGEVAVTGFCWGGSQTFRYATNQTDLEAAFVCYGTGPNDPSAISRINAPVYGFYGGNDARVNATIDESSKLMKDADKTYEPVIYEGAGHGFFRAGQEPEASEANQQARKEGWKRLISLLKE